MTKLTGQQIADAELTGWVKLLDGLQSRIRTPDFAAGLALVNAIGAVAEAMDHHPDLDLRYTEVNVRLTSHDVGGITGRDIRLARHITTIATDAGLQTERAGLSRVEFALDTPASEAAVPFWQAVLATEHASGPGAGDHELRDPAGVLPTVWFQPSGSEDPRQRWHPDIWVDPAEVQGRIDAAVAAGGSLVTDSYAPAFWILADVEGNKACLCTWQSRG